MLEKKKDNQEKVKDLLKLLWGEEPKVIAVPSLLIHFIGDASKAVLLNQLLYWSDRGTRKDGFIFKTYKEIFEETGIKERTCYRYYNEFKEKGFFNWEVKKAYGYPTIHFKLDVTKLSAMILTFWQKRNGQIVGNELDKKSESLTENTDIDSLLSYSENVLTDATNFLNQNQKEVKHTSFTVDVDGVDNSFDLADIFVPPAENPFPVSSSFEASLENQYWAGSTYPKKSPKLTTENFIDHFTVKGEKDTLSGWQVQWRRFMQNQYEPRGYSKEKLLAEHEEIRRKVSVIIYKFASGTRDFLLHRDSFYSILCKEENSFSKETVESCLKSLVSKGIFASYFGQYYYVKRKAENGEFIEETDLNILYYGWNDIDARLQKQIINNFLVSREDLAKMYLKPYQKSVDVYLKVGVQEGELIETGGYYYSRMEYEEDTTYRNRVDAKILQLGLTNSFHIEHQKSVEDVEKWAEKWNEDELDDSRNKEFFAEAI